MKNLKKLSISLIVFLLCFALCYLFGAFISQQLNPADWSIEGRVAYLFASISFGSVLSVFTYFEL